MQTVTKQSRVVISLIIALLFSSASSASQADSKFIPSREYFKTALAQIDEAKTSIDACLYLANFYPRDNHSQVYQLLNALAKAQARGVKVKVILDADDEEKNLAAAGFLKRAGVDVYFDEPLVTTHAKVLVVDGDAVLLGSSNWTESALARNFEANVLIHSKEVAAEVLGDLGKIKTTAVEDPDGPVVMIPEGFLDKSILGEMVNESDDRVMDAYLWLLKENADEVDYARLAVALGISDMTVEEYRRQINRTLEKLEQKYRLIRVSTQYGKPAQVSLETLKGDVLSLPLAYWRLGWDRELDFPAKVMWILNQYYSANSAEYPRWFKTVAAIAEEHGISEGFVSTGTSGLRRWNLLEVKYGDLGMQGGARLANEYSLNVLYDRDEEKEKMAALNKRYGEQVVESARLAAQSVYEDHDVDGIERLAGLEKKFGEKTVRAAVDVITQKSPDNPKRTIAYLIRTIEGIGEGS